MTFDYPHEVMNFEWKRIYPWAKEAYNEMDKLFHLSGVEHEIIFKAGGTYIAQRGKESLFPYTFDKLPTIKERYKEVSKRFEPFVSPSVANAIQYICDKFCKTHQVNGTIEDLKKFWLDGEREFVVEYLDELVEENINAVENCYLTNKLLDKLYSLAA